MKRSDLPLANKLDADLSFFEKADDIVDVAQSYLESGSNLQITITAEEANAIIAARIQSILDQMAAIGLVDDKAHGIKIVPVRPS